MTLMKAKARNILLRNVPDELMSEIDTFAKANAGFGGAPSRIASVYELIRRGLVSSKHRAMKGDA
jgi:hypothetical protein